MQLDGINVTALLCMCVFSTKQQRKECKFKVSIDWAFSDSSLVERLGPGLNLQAGFLSSGVMCVSLLDMTHEKTP